MGSKVPCTLLMKLIGLDDIIPFPFNVMRLPECVIEDYGMQDDYLRAMRPAIDALWNAAGYPKAFTFNGDGVWTGEWNK